MRSKLSLSSTVNGLILLSLVFVIFNTSLYKIPRKVIYWDVLEYYAYLPATFIYHDLSLKFSERDPAYFSDKFWPIPTPSGGRVTKMSMGMAILYSPFFFTAHAIATISGIPATGFTAPYQLALQLSCLCYLAVGLYFLRKILLPRFGEVVTSISIAAVVVGTNLYYYAAIESPMSHVYSFSLIAVFVYLTIKWYGTPNLKYSFLLGLLGGLITLVRPTNAIVYLFFALWGIVRWSDVIRRIQFFFRNFWLISLMGACFLIVWIPQLVYWKVNSGQWFFYSYTDQHFFFKDPQLLNGLFSYRKGWLLYTPMMILALVGIFCMRKNQREFIWPVVVFTCVDFYIIVSWWTWWYGGSLGLRPMIDSYAILIFPLAAWIRYILTGKTFIKTAGILLISLLTLHAVYESAQYVYGAIHWDSMTRAAYWDSFGRLHPSSRFYNLVKEPDYSKAMKGDRDK
jgi:hypothetical protein